MALEKDLFTAILFSTWKTTPVHIYVHTEYTEWLLDMILDLGVVWKTQTHTNSQGEL
jgi:hypothetical protein